MHVSRQLFALSVALVVAAVGCSDEGPNVPTEVSLAKGGEPGPPEGKGGGRTDFQITDFWVETFKNDTVISLTGDLEIDGAVDPDGILGCPVTGNSYELCNKLTLTFEGSVDSIRYTVGHDVRGLFYSDVDNPRWARAHSHSMMPYVPVAPGTNTVVVYWQGQRKYAGGWDKMPDLDPLGGLDRFAFRLVYKKGQDVRVSTSLVAFPEGGAQYRGWTAATFAYPVIDDVRFTQDKRRGKNRPSPTYLKFELQSFTNEADISTNIATDHTILAIRPGGSRYIVWDVSIGIDYDDPDEPTIYKQEFVTEDLTQLLGCHQFEVIGVYPHSYSLPAYDGREVVWDPALAPPDTIKVEVGESVTWSWGSCGY